MGINAIGSSLYVDDVDLFIYASNEPNDKSEIGSASLRLKNNECKLTI